MREKRTAPANEASQARCLSRSYQEHSSLSTILQCSVRTTSNVVVEIIVSSGHEQAAWVENSRPVLCSSAAASHVVDDQVCVLAQAFEPCTSADAVAHDEYHTQPREDPEEHHQVQVAEQPPARINAGSRVVG